MEKAKSAGATAKPMVRTAEDVICEMPLSVPKERALGALALMSSMLQLYAYNSLVSYWSTIVPSTTYDVCQSKAEELDRQADPSLRIHLSASCLFHASKVACEREQSECYRVKDRCDSEGSDRAQSFLDGGEEQNLACRCRYCLSRHRFANLATFSISQLPLQS